MNRRIAIGTIAASLADDRKPSLVNGRALCGACRTGPTLDSGVKPGWVSNLHCRRSCDFFLIA